MMMDFNNADDNDYADEYYNDYDGLVIEKVVKLI